MFGHKNSQFKLKLFKNYSKMLVNMHNINLGQIDFLNSLVSDNKDICFHVYYPKIIYSYVISMIKTHGKYDNFLSLFE